MLRFVVVFKEIVLSSIKHFLPEEFYLLHITVFIWLWKGTSNSGTILPNSHLIWSKPTTPSSHWRTPRPRYSQSTFSHGFILFLYSCALFPIVFKRQFNHHGFLRNGMFSFLFLGWCYEIGSKGNEESIQASENWPDWGEMCAGFCKNVHWFLKASKWMCMWWGEPRRGTESWASHLLME